MAEVGARDAVGELHQVIAQALEEVAEAGRLAGGGERERFGQAHAGAERQRQALLRRRQRAVELAREVGDVIDDALELEGE